MAETISIPARFNGPLDSGNGGYCAGVVASFVDGPAEVTIRRPVPLDRALPLHRDADGSIHVLDGDALVIEARPAPDFDLDLPAPVDSQQAHEATARHRGSPDSLFRRCFVCSSIRDDSLNVHAGPVDGRPLVASPWTPPPWTVDSTGHVRPEFVWSVLDCPTFFAAHIDIDLTPSVLARFTGRLDAPALAAEEHVVIAWPLAAHGRKREAAAALLSAEGEALAVARALMIELRDP
ncbi:MAG TPA: hypothetical protein VH391_05675 [Solirubrobacterales bacterium]